MRGKKHPKRRRRRRGRGKVCKSINKTRIVFGINKIRIVFGEIFVKNKQNMVGCEDFDKCILNLYSLREK
jgi:hypothetical protein